MLRKVQYIERLKKWGLGKTWTGGSRRVYADFSQPESEIAESAHQQPFPYQYASDRNNPTLLEYSFTPEMLDKPAENQYGTVQNDSLEVMADRSSSDTDESSAPWIYHQGESISIASGLLCAWLDARPKFHPKDVGLQALRLQNTHALGSYLHRRAESAPAMPPMNRPVFGVHNMGSNVSLSQDVFDEEEEDNFLAGEGASGSQSSNIQVQDSHGTSAVNRDCDLQRANQLHRKHPAESMDPYNSEGEDRNTHNKSSKRPKTSPEYIGKIWACPYSKHDPATYSLENNWKCSTHLLNSISRLK